MRIKSGVKVAGMQPELMLGLQILAPVVQRFLPEMVVTSICDGDHMEGSLHYKGLAADIRTYIAAQGDIREGTLKQLRDACAVALGPDWDVILEKDHLHVEFDPD